MYQLGCVCVWGGGGRKVKRECELDKVNIEVMWFCLLDLYSSFW